MQEYKRLILLILIMAVVAGVIGVAAIWVIYQGGLARERLRLQDIATSNARLLDSIAVFDQRYSTFPEGAGAGSIEQFIAAHEGWGRRGLGDTGEIILGRSEGRDIVLLLRSGRETSEHRISIPIDSGLAEPLRAALDGRTGTMIGRDYAGREVLAGFAPVTRLGLGVVAKTELAEVRRRFTASASTLALIGAIAVAAASALFFGITEPIIRRQREGEMRFRELFESMSGGAAVFQAVEDGRDFVFRDFNRRGEQIARIDRRTLLGRRVTEVFPGIRALGLLAVMTKVWQSGEAQRLTRGYYRDSRIEGWRDSYVYRLPNGEVVTLFDDVTEREQGAEALRESETRFRGSFENAAVGMAHVGFGGGWLRVNQRLCEILGYSHDELMQRTFQDITHPDDLEITLSRFGALMRGEVSRYQLQKRYFHKDGHVVWVNLTSALQRDTAGRPLYSIGIVEDISAQKRAEEALRDSESRMRALLDASQDEVLLVSADGIVLGINKAAKERLAKRVRAIEPIGAPLASLLPPNLAEARMIMVRQVAATATPAQTEVPIRGRWFEFWFYPVLLTGQPVTEVAVYAREITRRKHAENELRRLYQAIQQSPASIVITDTRGDIVYVNPKFSEMTGYSQAEAIGKNPRLLKSGYTSDEEYKRLWATITSGEVWRGEFKNRTKSGDIFWELASIAPVKDAHGQIINYVAVKEDITDRRATEAQLRQAQKMDAVGQLTGGIAHDFNNLLTIILGNLQLLEDVVGDDAAAKSLVTDALWSARRGGELTHRLLAFARRQPLNPKIADLNAVVDGLTELLRRTLGNAIGVRVSLGAAPATTRIDTGELERAVVNLAINARDAMPGGGVLTLATSNARLDGDATSSKAPDPVAPGPYVLLTVSDTGIGIAPEIQARIFEPFFTTKEIGRGSGLGLSMVYGFVKQSGGHVAVASGEGVGTTFTLYFPAIESEERDAALAAAAAGAAAARVAAPGRVALLIEDEAKLRKIAASLLRKAGFSVLEAENGLDALDLATTVDAIDLVFSDVELPGGLYGNEVAERVRHRFPAAQVLLTSGYPAGRGGDAAGPCADVPLLAKPYSRDQFMAQIRAMFPPPGNAAPPPPPSSPPSATDA